MVTERKPTRRPHAAKRTRKRKPVDAIANLIRDGKRIPEEELARIPRDLAYNFDHYHDGSPKQP